MTQSQPPVDPPEPQFCTVCEGDTEGVQVSQIIDANGRTMTVPSGPISTWVKCFHCNGEGFEPPQEPDPDRQRDEAIEKENYEPS
jgi:hypothetical protein